MRGWQFCLRKSDEKRVRERLGREDFCGIFVLLANYHLRLSMYQTSLSFVDKDYIAEVVVASALVVTKEKIYNLRFQKY